MFFGESIVMSLFIIGTVCLFGSLIQILVFPRLSLFLSMIPIIGFFVSSLFLDAIMSYTLAIGVYLEQSGASGGVVLLVMGIFAAIIVTLIMKWCVGDGGVKSTDL